MKKQLLSLLCITLAVIGLACIGWGVYGALDNNGVEATAAPTIINTRPELEISPVSKPGQLSRGVKVSTYSVAAESFLSDFNGIDSQGSFVSGIDSACLKPAADRYYVFDGYFHADKEGEYSFVIDCGGSVSFSLGGNLLLKADQRTKATITVRLKEGYYPLEAHAFGDVYLSCGIMFGGQTNNLSDFLYCTGNVKSPEITEISFLASNNSGLICDVKTERKGSTFSCLLPAGVELSGLVPSFTANGAVSFNGVAAVSGQTRVDMSGICEVTAQGGESQKKYAVSVRRLETGLPSVSITSDKPIASKENYIDAVFAISGGGASYGADLEATACTAKVRGAYSSGLEKKPYTLKFAKKTPVLDLTPEKSWILVASHLDLSQMRNYTAYEIAREFDATEFSPRMRFVDVFVNGEYRGLYLLGDRVDISSTRFTVDKKTDEPDIGVFLELEKDFRAEGVKGYDYFQTPQGWCVTFKDPNADDLTKEQREYIADYFIAAEAAIISGEGYEQYIDVDSFIDWFLVETLFKNCDSEFTSSIYFHKDRGGKLKMGPVWDFDSGLGNHEGFPELLDTAGWQPRYGTYFEYLMKDADFRRRMSARWQEKHEVVEKYGELVDSTKELIRKSFDENFKVYNILQNGIPPVPSYISDLKSIDGQAEFMKNWVDKRIAWLDAEFAKADY